MSLSRAAVPALVLLLAAVAGLAADGPALAFDPPEWRFGEARYDENLSREVVVSNSGGERGKLSFIPTCDCLRAEPRALEVEPGGTGVVTLSLDPAEYDGAIELDFIVRTNVAGLEKALFRVSGTVRGRPEPGGASRVAGASGRSGEVSLLYFSSAGCRSCERYLATGLPELERRLGVSIAVERKNIFDAADFELYRALLGELGEEERAYPALLVGRTLLQGEREIREGAENAIASLLRQGPEESPLAASRLSAAAPAPRELRLAPVVAAGLLDGINPCAFTTLVFLVSALAVAGRGRREVLVIGSVFAAAVFASYFAIGLGAFSALRAASAFPVVSRLLKWLLFGVLVLFAALSVYDFAVIRRGQPTRILLQLPTALKKRIHASIRSGAKSAAMVAGTLAMGFLVSVFELACTGQVYFPTIAYLVRSRAGASAYLYLALYNVGFILPLLVVFVLTFFGLTSRRLGEVMLRSMGGVKLALAALFVMLAGLTVII